MFRSFPRSLCTVVLVCAGLATLVANGAGADPAATYVVPREFRPAAQRPAMVEFYGFGGDWVTNLQWTSWGGPAAAATGIVHIFVCHTDCGDGNDSSYSEPGTLRLSRPCSRGAVSYYTQAGYTYVRDGQTLEGNNLGDPPCGPQSGSGPEAPDVVAEDLALTAQTIAETLATQDGGSYARVSVSALRRLAVSNLPTAPGGSAYLSSATGTADGYDLVATSATGNRFTNRASGGVSTRTCGVRGQDGCPSSGTW